MIDALDPKRPGAFGLLVRHAERDPIRSGDSVWDAQLTPQGRNAAREFGQKLGNFRFGGAVSSPVQRCRDTAALIAEGWNQSDFFVKSDRMLLDAYIENNPVARNLFETVEPCQLILDHMDKPHLDGFRSMEAGSILLLNWMIRQMTPGTLMLFVTHDAILMPFTCHFHKTRYSMQNWFPFLGDAVIHVDRGQIRIDGTPIDAVVSQSSPMPMTAAGK